MGNHPSLSMWGGVEEPKGGEITKYDNLFLKILSSI